MKIEKRRVWGVVAPLLLSAACSAPPSSAEPPGEGRLNSGDGAVASVEAGVTACKTGTVRVCESGCPPYPCVKPVCTCEPVQIQTVVPDPWFQLVDIEYSVPGANSNVSYNAGSYVGNHTDYQTMLSIGIDVHLSGGLGDVENKFDYGTISGGGNGLQITSSSGTQVAANMVDDAIHHEKDIFSVWVNPVMRVTSKPGSNSVASVDLLSSGSGPVIETVTAAELLGQVAIPSWKSLSNLTAANKQQILGMDPFFAAGGFQSSDRYDYQTSIDLEGPSDPGGNLVSHTYDLQSDLSQDTTKGWQINDDLTADFKFGAVFSGGLDLQYQYQKIATHTTGTVADASLTLGTPNRCVHVGVDVYRDNSFNTFIAIAKATDSTGAASAWDCCGSPHSLCEQGQALSSSCSGDSCITSVCAEDPYCCSNYWDQTCVDEASACGSTSCLQTVCSEDPWCCSNYWDSYCVGEATACAPSSCGSPQ